MRFSLRGGHRDDRPTQEQPKEEKEPGWAQAQGLQAEVEGRTSVCLATELQEVGGSLRVQGGELPGYGATRLYRDPAQKVFMRWVLIKTTATLQGFSAGVRGVGGAIDVATITRTEGFRAIQEKEIVGERFGF